MSKRERSRVELLQEAVALEQAGGLWEADHIAALYPVSRRSVYALPGLPRTRVRLTGKERFRVGYDPKEVRAYFDARKSHTIVDNVPLRRAS